MACSAPEAWRTQTQDPFEIVELQGPSSTWYHIFKTLNIQLRPADVDATMQGWDADKLKGGPEQEKMWQWSSSPMGAGQKKKKNPIKDQKVVAGDSLYRNTMFLFSYLYVTSLFSVALWRTNNSIEGE